MEHFAVDLPTHHEHGNRSNINSHAITHRTRVNTQPSSTTTSDDTIHSTTDGDALVFKENRSIVLFIHDHLTSILLGHKQFIVEVLICVAMVVTAFSIAYNHVIHTSVETLVPSTSTSSCVTSPQLYVLPEQSVAVTFPASAKFVDIRTGITYPLVATGTFYGQWSSCRKEAYDTESIRLSPQGNYNITPITIPLVDSRFGRFLSTVESDDKCFSLSCGFDYHITQVDDKIKDFLNTTMYLLIPYTVKDFYTIDNGDLYVGNSQLFASLFATNNSVAATCAVGITGTLQVVLTESNSISGSGTYLCTTYTSTLQAVSSALSVALTVAGVVRFYFLGKSFLYQAKPM